MSRQERWWASQGAGGRVKKAFLLRREKYAVRAPEFAEQEAVSPRAAAAPPAADHARAMALRRQLLTAAESRAFAVRVVPLHFAELDTSLFAA